MRVVRTRGLPVPAGGAWESVVVHASGRLPDIDYRVVSRVGNENVSRDFVCRVDYVGYGDWRLVNLVSSAPSAEAHTFSDESRLDPADDIEDRQWGAYEI